MSKKTFAVKWFVKPIIALAALAGLAKSAAVVKARKAQKAIEQ